MKLNIGCENDYKKGWINLDFNPMCHPDILFDLNKLPYLPYEDDEFDEINCTEVLEHLQKPREVLKELKRILKPKGILKVSMPNESNIITRLRFLFKGEIESFSNPELPHHYHFTSSKQQLELYKDYFNIKEITYITLHGRIYDTFSKYTYPLTKIFPKLLSRCMCVTLTKGVSRGPIIKIVNSKESGIKAYS